MATILLNVAAGAYGDAAIAGMSIVTRISMFINAFLIGFGQGFQPVCGFNYGAGLYARVRQGFWFCVKVGFFFLLVCAVAGMGYAEEIVSIFRKGDPAVVATGAAALRWQFITYPLGAWIVVSNMMLQTIRKPVRATILSSARQGLFFIPLIFILPYFLGLKGVGNVPGGVGHADLLPRHSIDLRGAGGDEEEGGGTNCNSGNLEVSASLFNFHGNYRLPLHFIEGSCMVLDAPEVYLSQINASDCTVVHGAIVDDTVCHICGRCPLGGTWNIGRNLAEGKLDAYGYIKVIQYLKTLENGFLCGILWWCRSLVEAHG